MTPKEHKNFIEQFGKIKITDTVKGYKVTVTSPMITIGSQSYSIADALKSLYNKLLANESILQELK